MGDRLYGYVDETSNVGTEGVDQTLIGAGVLVTATEVEPTAIEQALVALTKDPDRKRSDRKSLDERTLERGYFHASEDSANAHSHICTAISEQINGVFVCVIYDQYQAEREMECAGLDQQKTQNSAWCLAAEVISYDNTPLSMHVEQRKGLGNLNESWIEAFRRRRDWERYNLDGAYIPIAYPDMTCRSVEKNNPGVQIADFLLWASLRQMNGDQTWSERVGLKQLYDLPLGDGQITGVRQFSVGSKILDFPLFSYEEKLRETFGEWSSQADPIPRPNRYAAIEWVVCHCAKHRRNACSHLDDQINSCLQDLRNPNLSCHHTTIEAMARLYLRLFDTVQIYRTEYSWPDIALRTLFAARETAALAIRKDQTASRFLVAEWCRWRKYCLQHSPNSLPFNDEHLDTPS